ncbi:MAG: hypothetical protein ACYTFO_00320 [Planctomycetota bacterium]
MSESTSTDTQPTGKTAAKRKHDRWVKLGFLVVALGIVAFLVIDQRSFPAPAGWGKNLAEALATAQAENRHVVVLFVKHPMGELAKTVITQVINKSDNHKAVKEGNFVPVMVRGPSNQMREDYGLTVFPTLMILDPAGQEVKRREGLDTRPEVPFRSEFLDLEQD